MPSFHWLKAFLFKKTKDFVLTIQIAKNGVTMANVTTGGYRMCYFWLLYTWNLNKYNFLQIKLSSNYILKRTKNVSPKLKMGTSTSNILTNDNSCFCFPILEWCIFNQSNWSKYLKQEWTLKCPLPTYFGAHFLP